MIRILSTLRRFFPWRCPFAQGELINEDKTAREQGGEILPIASRLSRLKGQCESGLIANINPRYEIIKPL